MYNGVADALDRLAPAEEPQPDDADGAIDEQECSANDAQASNHPLDHAASKDAAVPRTEES